MKQIPTMISRSSIQCQLLGVQVDALSISDLNFLISQSIQHNHKWVIANHNLHSLYLYHHDAKMRDFYKLAAYTHIDGMPLIVAGKLLGYPLKREQRVTYVDWVWKLMGDAVKNNWRIFYLGSKPGVAERGAEILCKRFPGLQIQTAHGYIDMRRGSEDNQQLIKAINAYQPHVLMVGMGMPRQEHWILEHFDILDVNSILPSGACIDYVAGAVPTPPRWMGRFGLEWLYRLFSEPKRLWKRYLVEPWFVMKLFIYDFFSSSIKT